MRRTAMAFFLLSVAAMLSTGCIVGPHACTEEARSSVTVTVIGPNGPICDANVVVHIGTEVAPLTTFGPPDCTYAGVYERSGPMTVVASKTGFATASKMVTVGSDECHVIGEKVTLTLTPE